MSQPLTRYTDYRADDQRKIARIILETGDPAPTTTVTHATLPGDTRRLRGIPVAGGACGTSPGTDPLQALIALDDNRWR
jgi:hypothetical protein